MVWNYSTRQSVIPQKNFSANTTPDTVQTPFISTDMTGPRNMNTKEEITITNNEYSTRHCELEVGLEDKIHHHPSSNDQDLDGACPSVKLGESL